VLLLLLLLQVLNITAPLVVLDQPSRQGYGGIKLCLLDTPGPNEAGEEGLKYQVGRYLQECHNICYIVFDWSRWPAVDSSVFIRYTRQAWRTAAR
jgi:hypothetical protein